MASIFTMLGNLVFAKITSLKIDKLAAFKIFSALAGIFMLLHLLGTVNGSNGEFFFFLLMTASEALFTSPLATLAGIFLRDLITADNLVYGLNRESMVILLHILFITDLTIIYLLVLHSYECPIVANFQFFRKPALCNFFLYWLFFKCKQRNSMYQQCFMAVQRIYHNIGFHFYTTMYATKQISSKY